MIGCPSIAALFFFSTILWPSHSCPSNFDFGSEKVSVHHSPRSSVAAARYLTEEDIFAGGAVVFRVTPATALEYYLRKSGTQRPLRVKRFRRKRLRRMLAANDAAVVSLIQNRYWKGQSVKAIKWLRKRGPKNGPL